MQLRQITVSYHAILRFVTQFEEWAVLSNEHLEALIIKLITNGITIGAQLGDDIAIESVLPTNERVYFVGRRIAGEFIVCTTLTREKLIANLRQIGIGSPDKPLKRRKFNRRNRRASDQRLKYTQPWRIDRHFEPTEPKPKRQRKQIPPPPAVE